MPEHLLVGCRPVPLASYLKSLAVLRLVGEQADPEARGFWRDDTFVLRTGLDRDALTRFFLYDYRPTPIIAPWNGGSGFYPGDNREAIRRISGSSIARLEGYSAVARAAAEILGRLDIREKVSSEGKPALLEACRATLPDDVLDWIDAAFLLTGGGPKYPPLLGTGGNDGRLEFTNNFMQRLLDVIDISTGNPTDSSASLLQASLSDEPTDRLTDGAIGQFLPSGAGGANASSGFDGGSRLNPWDFVLMLEGAATFAAAAVRRMGRATQGALSYPFTVRSTAVGYGSASSTDEGASRGEIWLPLWDRPAKAAEIRALLGEGRARVSGRTARNGVDFARAVATLGIDRGISEFQRYGLLVRNGLSYLAAPVGRFRVREQSTVRRLDDIDRWLDSFRRRASAARAPASARRALDSLEGAIVDLCQRGGPDRVQAVLIALGDCERTMARSLRWATDPKTRLAPVPPLSPAWLTEADDGSAELRLAAALASVFAVLEQRRIPLRCQMEPVATRVQRSRLRVEWDATADRDVVWTDGDLVAALNATLTRRLVLCEQSGVGTYPDRASQLARPDDVAAFIEGRTDDSRLAALLWGTILIDWPRCDRPPFDGRSEVTALPAVYSLLKLCFAGAAAPKDLASIPVVRRIPRLAASGDGAEASRVAVRRLHASGLAPAVGAIHCQGSLARRVVAAVLFPLAPGALAGLRRAVLRPSSQEGEMTP
jgi:CRISPR-associated protein Csx17